MLLMIDNYDSFTYNLVQLLGSMGLEIEVLRNDEFAPQALEELPLQGIVISPGPGVPAAAGRSMEAVERFQGRLPILGICLGHQVIGACSGARVERAARVMHGKTSPVYHGGEGIFQGVESPLEAMRYHSLLLAAEDFPPALEVLARTKEGEIMALCHRRHRDTVGLQFHPESLFTPAGKRIVQNYLCTTGLLPPEGQERQELTVLDVPGI